MTPRKRRDRLNSIREIAAQLQQSDDLAAPDLTQSILARVDANRPFLDRQTRRMVWVGRGALVASVAAIVLTAALMQRFAPETVEIVARPAPLSNVVESVKSNATERLVVLREAVNSKPLVESGEVALESSFDAMPRGGLLTLVTPVAVSLVGEEPVPQLASRCELCGPMLPPARAARLVTESRSVGAEQAPAMALSASRSSVTMAASFESPWTGSRVRLAGDADARSVTAARLAANATRVGSRRILLNELTPLGPGAACDSALAPK